MRKVTRDAVGAFLAGGSDSFGNTHSDGRSLFLHGNRIAEIRDDGSVWATLAGWGTPTTRERLNGVCSLLEHFGVFPSFFGQSDFAQFWGGAEIGTHEWVQLAPAGTIKLGGAA